MRYVDTFKKIGPIESVNLNLFFFDFLKKKKNYSGAYILTLEYLM